MIEVHQARCIYCKQREPPAGVAETFCPNGSRHTYVPQVERIDDAPIKDFIDRAGGTAPGVLSDLLKVVDALDPEQRRYALGELVAMYQGLQRRAEWLATEQGVASSQVFIDLAKAARTAGQELWPHLLNGKVTP